jgi:hypothetical protein
LPGPKRIPPQRPGNPRRRTAARADGEGYRYFSQLAGAQPGKALPLALAGFFQARLGQDAGAARAKLAVRDQFPAILLRAAYHGLAAAHAVLGHDDQAAEAERRSGLGAAPADTQLMFGGFWATVADGFRRWRPGPRRRPAWGPRG